ncbi:MAG TPA: sugar transferase [Bacteroidales bacterium]|jgi:exopolysaccharide biosynthesis polyprenyl glycosylphosphotransferase|nr:sugar transferase [Bacteroidales bacterium]
MNKNLQIAKYVIADYITALLAWSLFFFYRKYYVDPYFLEHYTVVFDDPKFFYGIIAVPIFWLILYAISGQYRKIYRKSRLKELGHTLSITLIGVLIIFFVLILDDVIRSYKSYYQSFIVLFVLHFSFTYLARFLLTTITNNKIHHRKIGFNTVMVGCNGNALSIFQEIENQPLSPGNKFIGFVDAGVSEENLLDHYIPHLGTYKDLKRIVEEHKVEEVIIAFERSEKDAVERVITELEETNVVIKIAPIMQDILLGSVKTSSIYSPLIEISTNLMPAWQMVVKRAMDIVVSLIAIIVLSPVFLFTAIGVKLSSPGPILYCQPRVGLRGKIFKMVKFRSMYQDAESNGPQLSSKDDPRITPFGKIMRQYRLDEIPQFFTVLKGDMSLVGPRPERPYYIEQIIQKMPHYKLLLKVKPGITSWGQVKFGYAENLDQMIERAKFDLIYLENMSIAMDIKILVYTIMIVLQGRGK